MKNDTDIKSSKMLYNRIIIFTLGIIKNILCFYIFIHYKNSTDNAYYIFIDHVQDL